MTGLVPKPTQEQRILGVLQRQPGQWISGRFFLQTMMLSQYHARIWELQRKGHPIEASKEKDEFGFKSYRITLSGQSELQLP